MALRAQKQQKQQKQQQQEHRLGLCVAGTTSSSKWDHDYLARRFLIFRQGTRLPLSTAIKTKKVKGRATTATTTEQQQQQQSDDGNGNGNGNGEETLLRPSPRILTVSRAPSRRTLELLCEIGAEIGYFRTANGHTASK
jgi:hypothetical protein